MSGSGGYGPAGGPFGALTEALSAFLGQLLPSRPPRGSEIQLTRLHRVEIAVCTVLAVVCIVWAGLRYEVIYWPNGRVDTAGNPNLPDPMLATGFATALAALALSLFIERRYLVMMRQIEADQLIDNSTGALSELNARVQRLCRRTRHGLTLLVFGVVVVGFLAVADHVPVEHRTEFFAGAFIVAALAGNRLGTAAGFGFFARFLGDMDLGLRLTPGHPDGVAGVNRIGGFLLFQGLVASAPLIWLTTWILLIGLSTPDTLVGKYDYDHWQTLMYALWPIAFGVMYIGFIAPVLSLRGTYGAARRDMQTRLLPSTDARIAAGHAALEAATESASGEKAAADLNDAIAFRSALADLPGLPLSGLGRRLLAATSLFPAITFVIEVLSGKDSLAGGAITWLLEEAGKLL